MRKSQAELGNEERIDLGWEERSGKASPLKGVSYRMD